MGCYNVTCGITRTTIGAGDKVALIPLIELKSSYDENRSTLRPFALPIFGEYDDYGGIADIVSDVNTNAIEQRFLCKIDHFGEFIVNPYIENNAKNTFPENTTSMFIHRQVYDELAKNPITESGDPDNLYTSTCYTPPLLLKMAGFIQGERDNNKERYQVPYHHPELKGIVIWGDGQFIRVTYKGKEVTTHSIFSFADLQAFVESKDMVMPKSFDVLKSLRANDLYYDENAAAYEEYTRAGATITKLKTATEDVDIQSLLTELKSLTRMFNFERKSGIRYIFKFGGRYDEDDSEQFDKLYAHLYSSPEFKSLLVDYKTFEQQCFHNNIILQPVGRGLQHGNLYADLRMGRLITDISLDKLKQRCNDE